MISKRSGGICELSDSLKRFGLGSSSAATLPTAASPLASSSSSSSLALFVVFVNSFTASSTQLCGTAMRVLCITLAFLRVSGSSRPSTKVTRRFSAIAGVLGDLLPRVEEEDDESILRSADLSGVARAAAHGDGIDSSTGAKSGSSSRELVESG